MLPALTRAAKAASSSAEAISTTSSSPESSLLMKLSSQGMRVSMYSFIHSTSTSYEPPARGLTCIFWPSMGHRMKLRRCDCISSAAVESMYAVRLSAVTSFCSRTVFHMTAIESQSTGSENIRLSKARELPAPPRARERNSPRSFVGKLR